MTELKRIQLRGISRSPSDRLTEDGGCAESLNVVLGDAELAPSFVPEDITDELGLPADIEAEKVFVHKTPSYENTIIYSEGNLKAYSTSGKLLSVIPLNSNEVKDIVSFGNTIVVLTDQGTEYILCRAGSYAYLGTEIPFPKLTISGRGKVGMKSVEIDVDELGIYGMYRAFSTSDYNTYLNDGTNKDSSVRKLLEKINDEKVAFAGELGRQGIFWGPVYVMYGVRLINGTVVTTTPELLSRSSGVIPQITWGLKLFSNFENNNGNKEFVGGIKADFDVHAYTIGVECEEDFDITQWKELIHSVDVYITSPINTASDYRRIHIDKVTDSNTASLVQTRTATTTWGVLDELNQVLGKGNFYRVKSFNLASFQEGIIPKNKLNWDSEDFDVTEETLVVTPDQLPSLNIDHIYYDTKKMSAEKATKYNDNLLLISAKNWMKYSGSQVYYASDASITYRAWYKFLLNDGSVVFGDDAMKVEMPGLLTYASAKANSVEMIIRRQHRNYTDNDHTDWETVTTFSYIKLPMFPHPSMPCSYAFIGLGKHFGEYAFEINGSMSEEEIKDYDNTYDEAQRYVSLENKIILSSWSNPFVFPQEKMLTFQNRVLGAYAAITALSQGQFGQFPLYVFTEDGIWAMETAADGSFVSSKPLSREVCVNPKSITSVDNGVVFVTDKGVMLLQGSQVINLSPNMNGRHYTIEGPAQTIIEGQPFFKDLLPSITDATHFMAYVKAASIAYDYAGQRLVFIKEGEDYQYVYKLDTQTWHKVAYGIDMIAPINSFPECSVMGKTKKDKELVYIKSKGDPQFTDEEIINEISRVVPTLDLKTIRDFVQNNGPIDLNVVGEGYQDMFYDTLLDFRLEDTTKTIPAGSTCIYNLSTILDAQESRIPTRGVIATRPMDLGEPDVLKTVTDVRIRGQFRKGAAKFILLGSNDGLTFYTLSTLRGRAWKLFRIIILADLEPTERISWIDVQYEPRFTNKLR